MDDSILTPYQIRVITDEAPVVTVEKSRRIGISWAVAFKAVRHCLAGTGNVHYQSYSLDMAKEFIGDCEHWAGVVQAGAWAVDEVAIEQEDRSAVTARRVRLANGREIYALPSSARAWRSKGRPGELGIIDEAAFVDDLPEVLKAAMATLVWGGRLVIMSTHKGQASAFAQRCRDIRDGAHPGSLHTIPIRQALAEGLYKRICKATGRQWSQAAEAKWEAALRAQYAPNDAEELDCIPSEGLGAWLTWESIRAAEHPDANRPALAGKGPFYLGVDIARRRHLWVATVLERVGDILWLREQVILRNQPFSLQHEVSARLHAKYNFVRSAFDQTGMGEEFVEVEQAAHGRHRVEGALMTGPRKLDMATALAEKLQDRRLRIHDDPDMRADLHSVRAEAGPTGAPRLVADEDGLLGHGDRFWSLALAVAAAATHPRAYAYQPVNPRLPPKSRRTPDDDWLADQQGGGWADGWDGLGGRAEGWM